MFLTAPASALTAAQADSVESSLAMTQTVESAPDYGNGTSSSQTVTPDSNVVVNVYEDSGYDGNSTVYPTTDVNPTYLPTVSSAASTDTYLPTSYIRNAVSLNTNGLTSQLSNYQYVTGDSWLQIDIWAATLGVSNNSTYTQWPEYGSTTYQDLSEQLSNVPASTHTDVETSWDSGYNVTFGNDGSNKNGVTESLSDAALLVGEQEIPVLGWVATGWGVLLDAVEASGAVNESSPITDALGANNEGTQSVNQWSAVSGGTAPRSANVFNQDTLFQTTLSYPNATSSGYIELEATNELSRCATALPCGVTPPADPQAGAYTTVEYLMVPATGVGGIVDLWSGGPPVPLANVVVQQQYTATTFQSNYEHPNASTGRYHVFLEPLTGYPNTYTQLNAYLSDPMGDTDTNLNELPTADWTKEGTDVETVDANLDGGQVNGTLTGTLVSGDQENIADATVKLCNSQGCISTTTNSAGHYALQFPVAGTSSDPDSVTISASGWTTTTYTGLELPVGEYSQESLSFPPQSGGGCVAEGTPILTPAGYVPVQNLRSGEAVLEYDFANQTLVDGSFLYGNTTPVNSVVDINHGLLYLTPTDQPVYIQNNTYMGWLPDPQNLTTADNLYDPVTLSWVHVTSVSIVREHTTVYDVVTSGFNNFVASGVLLDKKA